MTVNRLSFGVAIAACLAISPARAAFQDMSLGGRPQGMGGAFTAVANDSNAVYWNPAGLVQLGRQDASFMHGLLQDVKGLNLDYLSWAMPMDNAAFGLGWLRLGAKLEQGEFDASSSFSEDTFFISGAFKTGILSEGDFSVGVSMKRLSIATSEFENGAGLGFDVGVMFKAHEHFNIAAVARNLAADVKDEGFPTYFKLGLASPLWNDRLMLAADFDSKENIEGKEGLNVRYHVGAEIQPIPALALRGGYDNGDLTFGGGFAYSAFRLDYAYKVSEIFGAVHRVSLGSSFGALAANSEPEPEASAAGKVNVDAPKGLRGKVKKGQLELSWKAQKRKGIIGHSVYLQSGDGEWEKITDEPIVGNVYQVPGKIDRARDYQYAISAVVRGGAESELSNDVILKRKKKKQE